MAKRPAIFTLTLLLLLLLSLSLLQASANPDLTSLLNFKSAADPLNHLKSWTPTTSPCTWPGISCLPNSSRVSHLILENLNLHGPSSSLTHLSSLTQLRVLSLNHNNLSGPLPSNSFSNFTALKLLFLSHNNFSGPFPLSILSLSRLYRLDLSCNSFSGPIPFDKLSTFTPHLLTLRLQNNQFSGVISGLNLSAIQEFNVSNNQLTGQIPGPLSGFPRSVFAQNPGLCGFPLQACKGSGSVVSDPTQPGGPRTQTPSTTVSSSPSSLPMSTNHTKPQRPAKNKKSREGGLGTLSIVAIVLGDILILALVCTLLFCYFLKRTRESGKRSKLMESTEKIVYSSSPYGAQNGNQYGAFSERGRMVFFEGAKRFELEDLLRASAEMLGKGGFGTAYKAVLDDGSVVAVKRLKDGGGGKREFEQNMEVLGRLRHPNLVAWKAYYFAREEKLLVYDYMPNGSLFWLLHGNRGPGRTPLDWTTRLKIAAGAARGLTFIHTSCKALKLTHGNIKSTNILLDKSGDARVSDFGLALLSPPSSVNKSNGYRAPELSTTDGRRNTQRSDVYSFGVLLLEILTGKCPLAVDCGGGPGNGAVDLPRWVQSVVREEWTAEVFDLELMRYKDIEEEMVGLLQVAMACTCPSPDQRPKMSHVVKMIEEIRGVEVSPSHDNFDSVSDSPSLSEDTCGATSQ